MLAANAFTGDVAGHLVQLQRNRQTLLTGHLAIAFDLFVQCRCRGHDESIANLLQRSKIIQTNVAANVSRLIDVRGS